MRPLSLIHNYRCRLLLAWLLAGLVLTTGCRPLAAPAPSLAVAPARPTATADVATFVIYSENARTSVPTPAQQAAAALRATLADFSASAGDDPTGAKAAALVTLRNFVDASGPYRGAWWFENDQQGGMDEMLAVIFYGEASSSLDVRKAIAARFLWYCGGQGEKCQGHALVNFLAYFQAWREPWLVTRGFMNAGAKDYLALAGDVVHQQGILKSWIPGAEWFVQNPDGLTQAGPVDWETTLFHFANVHPTWDAFLRRVLGRAANGPNRLWVLTVGEARTACQAGMICPDMTQARP